MRWSAWLAVAVMGLGGCEVFVPTSDDGCGRRRGFDSGEALVSYLAQPDASPAVCDLRFDRART